MELEMVEQVGAIVATVEGGLEQRVAALESLIEELRASMDEAKTARVSASAAGRKTLPTAMRAMLARQGVVDVDAGALDGALSSLSIEQRIAVKSEMLRAGLLR